MIEPLPEKPVQPPSPTAGSTGPEKPRRRVPTPLSRDGRRESIEIAPVSGPPGAWRAITCFVRLAAHIFSILVLSRPGTPARSARSRELRHFLERMGVLWVKAGQLISLRRDLFTREFCDELSRLQDRAHGFDPAIARRTIEEELGVPLERIFREFEAAPIAAASIAQVHRARLAEGDELVAVKVQRPNAAATLEQDIRLMRRISSIFHRLGFYANMRWLEFVWELEQIMREEISFRYEASHMARMRKTLRKHRILVPRVHEAWSTERVLVMEFVEGGVMTDVIAMWRTDPDRLRTWYVENGITPRKVAQRLVGTAYRQVYEDNLFHADMHPGNIVLLRDDRIALIDFGTIGWLENEQLAIHRMFVDAIGRADYSKAIDMLFLLTPNLPRTGLTRLKDALIRTLRTWEAKTHMKGLPHAEKSMASLFQEVHAQIFRGRVEANWALLKLGRSWETLDNSLRYLDGDLNYPALLRKFSRRVERRRVRTELRRGQQDLPATAAVLLNQPRSLAESTFYEIMLLRRKAQVFGAATSKVGYLASLTFGTVGLGLYGLAMLLAGVLAGQHGGPAAGWFEWARRIPILPPSIWGAAIAICLYLGWRHRKIARYLETAEDRLPE